MLKKYKACETYTDVVNCTLGKATTLSFTFKTLNRKPYQSHQRRKKQKLFMVLKILKAYQIVPRHTTNFFKNELGTTETAEVKAEYSPSRKMQQRAVYLSSSNEEFLTLDRGRPFDQSNGKAWEFEFLHSKRERGHHRTASVSLEKKKSSNDTSSLDPAFFFLGS